MLAPQLLLPRSGHPLAFPDPLQAALCSQGPLPGTGCLWYRISSRPALPGCWSGRTQPGQPSISTRCCSDPLLGSCITFFCFCDQKPKKDNLKGERLILACGFRGFGPWSAGDTALRCVRISWWKGMVEECCSRHCSKETD